MFTEPVERRDALRKGEKCAGVATAQRPAPLPDNRRGALLATFPLLIGNPKPLLIRGLQMGGKKIRAQTHNPFGGGGQEKQPAPAFGVRRHYSRGMEKPRLAELQAARGLDPGGSLMPVSLRSYHFCAANMTPPHIAPI
ncbi:hypothetical protein SKAU_G00359020 [Synaphobranchus kaupii]|uniref:Uncharacterized protein n=1 Tax=Synaphobranchus kaupii TaxID=118154 RepID=A0A9Q1EHY9_SYNKA|nr:hypothetical protein SKAU_G00359020 [Synaphobranchus kaupii]